MCNEMLCSGIRASGWDWAIDRFCGSEIEANKKEGEKKSDSDPTKNKWTIRGVEKFNDRAYQSIEGGRDGYYLFSVEVRPDDDSCSKGQAFDDASSVLMKCEASKCTTSEDYIVECWIHSYQRDIHIAYSAFGKSRNDGINEIEAAAIKTAKDFSGDLPENNETKRVLMQIIALLEYAAKYN